MSESGFYGRRIDLEDVLKSLRMVRKMGGLYEILKRVPSVAAQISDQTLGAIDDPYGVRLEAMILSMTRSERLYPEIIDDARINRIAGGCGASAREVRDFLDHLEKLPPSPGR